MRIKGGRASLPVPGIALFLYLASLLRNGSLKFIDTSTWGPARSIFSGIPKTAAPASDAHVPAPPPFSLGLRRGVTRLRNLVDSEHKARGIPPRPPLHYGFLC